MSLEDTRSLYLFMTLRAIISAAVRLSICGPMQGQRIEAELSAQCIQPLLASPAIQAQLVPRPIEDEVSPNPTLRANRDRCASSVAAEFRVHFSCCTCSLKGNSIRAQPCGWDDKRCTASRRASSGETKTRDPRLVRRRRAVRAMSRRPLWTSCKTPQIASSVGSSPPDQSFAWRAEERFRSPGISN